MFIFIDMKQGNKMGLGGHHHATSSPLQFFYGGSDPLGQPPPAHMGIPPYQLDPKTAGAIGNAISCLILSQSV